MYRLKDIQNALFGLVGWEQSYNPATEIDDGLTTTESGLTFQGAHPLCTLNNIRSIMPDDFAFKYPAWNANTNYGVGAKVRHNNEIWITLNANQNSEPNDTNLNWNHYNLLSDYLCHLTKNGIAKMVQQFVQDKQLRSETKTLLEHRTFFDGAARMKAIIDPKAKLVGFEIVPVRGMGVTTKINRIGLQMIGATGNVRLYLFHSSQVDPVRVINCNFTNTNGGFQWFTFDEPIYLPYMGNNTDSGGSWYLCYNQNDLPDGMLALNVTKDWSREPCGTCNIGSVEAWREITKYIQVSPFGIQAPEDFADYPEMFDVELVTYTNTQNYGINCEISVECDLTDFIIEQRAMFAPVLQKQIAYDVLRTMAMNPDVRVNRNQSNVSRMDVLYELDGNTNADRPGGLGYELKQAYKALSIDTRGIDRICLSCNNHGVKYRTV